MKNSPSKNSHYSTAEYNRKQKNALNHKRSLRKKDMRVMTSLPAGKMVPLGVAGILREDAVRKGSVRYSFEMHETAEILMNSVQVCVKAYLVPFLAFERFQSMDELNRSYAGTVAREGDTPIPFIETIPFDGDLDFYKYAGIHAKADVDVNSAYLEAYNLIWNFRAKNRSQHLETRTRLDGTLAPAFWSHQTFDMIVPDFDQAKIDGEVALNITNGELPVKGIGRLSTSTFAAGAQNVKESGGTDSVYPSNSYSGAAGAYHAYMAEDPDNVGYPKIYAEMQDNGITVSLSNIELARKTQAYAKIREGMSGYTGDVDEYIIDLLMQGITVPEQAYKDPMLLASKTTVFGMQKRYATDSGNLDKSAVNGATYLDIDIRTPRLTTGGVIMVVAEVVPEQLWERQRDPFLHTTTVETLPDALRDDLDPEKVSVITNEFVDVDHDTPNDTFGYAPLNFEWNENNPHIGGRFYRPEVDASFDEDRQRLWAVETQNPTLGEDFYLATEIHTKPFADSNQDPFESVGVGALIIEGNTVFGHKLIEASDDYAKVLEQAPQDRIEQD